MNFSKKNHDLVRQNEKNVKKSQKHDVNLQKNSTLYFQIGLILCLLATYFLMDMKFLTTENLIPNDGRENETEKVFSMVDFKIFEESVKKIKPKEVRKRAVVTNTINVVKNDFVLKTAKTEIITPDQNTSNTRSNPDNNAKAPKDLNKTVILDLVEQVPIFPGCEKLTTNGERKACMSEKISRLVRRKFDTSVGNELGLSGEQIIHVQFKIDKTGNVADIKTNAKFSQLEKETKRVISKIPKMEPGKQKNKNVSVMYTLPIKFQVFN